MDNSSTADLTSNVVQNAKGDLLIEKSNDLAGILPVGTNGKILSSDSSTETGLKQITPPQSGGDFLVMQIFS